MITVSDENIYIGGSDPPRPVPRAYFRDDGDPRKPEHQVQRCQTCGGPVVPMTPGQVRCDQCLRATAGRVKHATDPRRKPGTAR
jgi:hypothetical protein